ncbi:MAG: nodulin-26, partial [Planctomycetota bacterium]|nr:nodulin-26 [Planctomycetota bacterium]
MNRFTSMSLLLATAISGLAHESRAEGFSFRAGDRVVLLGGTFIEREQRYGHLELELTIASGGKATFRNLGWSGGTA